jgi:hypothetical protein
VVCSAAAIRFMEIYALYFDIYSYCYYDFVCLC